MLITIAYWHQNKGDNEMDLDIWSKAQDQNPMQECIRRNRNNWGMG